MDLGSTLGMAEQKGRRILRPFPQVLLSQPGMIISRQLGKKKGHIMHLLPKRKMLD